MSRLPSAPLLLSLVLLGAGCAPADPAVDADEVVRVMGVLASDDMRGRHAFSPDAMRAAEFIASEFEAIGLATPDGSDDYLQRFPAYAVAAADVAVSVAGRPVPDTSVIVRPGAQRIDWRPGSGAQVITLADSEDLPMAWRRASRLEGDVLLLVPNRESANFARYRRFLGRPVRGLDPPSGSSLVMVLSDAAPGAQYTVSASATISTIHLANVVGVLPGRRSDEIVLFSGHYDHVGVVRPVDGDSIANGANDDASGTTAVIELARYFAALGQPERTVMFAAFTAEESGGYGSRHFSGQMAPDRIVAMFNIEMIGKPAVEGPNTAWITGFERTDFGEILQRAVVGTPFEFYPDPYPDQNLFFRSDNATLARLGVPAHSISTTPIDVDPDYHQVTDEISTLDMEHMINTIRAIAAGAATIISGEETPTRIDPGTLQ